MELEDMVDMAMKMEKQLKRNEQQGIFWDQILKYLHSSFSLYMTISQ